MYATILWVHSWLRWIVVALGVLATAYALRGRASGRAYTQVDARVGLWFVAALDVQVTLGLTLYLFLSPFTRIGFADPGAAMHSSVLRFFLIEHAVSMLLALTAAHVGRVRTRRATHDRDKHQRAASGALIALLCILVGIPWPFLPYARPLARVSGPTTETTEAAKIVSAQTNELFQARCAPCHGPNGRGDGPGAMNLLPRPRDFHDVAWQRTVTDEDIETIIRRGGMGAGKSPVMPPHSDLDDDRIRALRAHIRELGK